jgi:hypothetical protein
LSEYQGDLHLIREATSQHLYAGLIHEGSKATTVQDQAQGVHSTSFMHTIMIEPISAALPGVYNHMCSISNHFERIENMMSFVARTLQRYTIEQQAL